MVEKLTNGVQLWTIFVVVICAIYGGVHAADRITGTIRFWMFDRGLKQLVQLPSNNADFATSGCRPSEPFTIIIHGWNEGTNTEWLKDMLTNFTAYRPGCLMFMHYGNNINNFDYFAELVPQFYRLSDALAAHLRRLESIGFDPAKGHIFGFSMGAQIALEGSRRYGPKKIKRIDACEPAGPGFDSNATYSNLDPKQAAQQVQCIHTSSNFGTAKRNCHMNWNMGNCGLDQPAAGPFPKGSHGLCPYFYNSAFQYRFYPRSKPAKCTAQRLASGFSGELRMGYQSDMNSGVTGELFADTTTKYPYTDEQIFMECII